MLYIRGWARNNWLACTLWVSLSRWKVSSLQWRGRARGLNGPRLLIVTILVIQCVHRHALHSTKEAFSFHADYEEWSGVPVVRYYLLRGVPIPIYQSAPAFGRYLDPLDSVQVDDLVSQKIQVDVTRGNTLIHSHFHFLLRLAPLFTYKAYMTRPRISSIY